MTVSVSATSMLPYPVGERVPPESIRHVVKQIATQFQPEKIILFGSYAYGKPHAGSDVDLLVVMDTTLKEGKQALQIRQAIQYHFGLDLIVRKPANLVQRLAWGDFFLREITSKGKVMYESSNSRMGAKS